MDSQQICDIEPDYLDSNAELSEESDSEQMERIPTKENERYLGQCNLSWN